MDNNEEQKMGASEPNPIYSEGEEVTPFLGLTAAKAAALVAKQVG